MALPNNGRTYVGVEFKIYGIRGVDTLESTTTIACQFSIFWKDSRLIWDPEDFGGVETTSLATDPGTNRNYIWTPDIQSY